MELDESDTVLSFLVVPFDFGDEHGDLLCITKATKDGQLAGTYRFRYSGGPGFEKDRTSRYRIGPVQDSAENRIRLLNALRLVARELHAKAGTGEIIEQEINGTWRDLMAAFGAPGFALQITRKEGSR